MVKTCLVLITVTASSLPVFNSKFFLLQFRSGYILTKET